MPMIKHEGFALDTDNLNASGSLYLYQYGLNKSLQDSIAGLAAGKQSVPVILAALWAERDETAAAKLAKTVTEWESLAGMPAPEAHDAAGIESFTKAVIHATKAARFESIIKGTVGATASGPRLRGLDAVMFEVALEAIKAAPAIKSGKVKWPTGKGAAKVIAGWVAQYTAKNADKVKAEAERRMSATAAAPDDIDDIFAVAAA